MSTAWSLTFNGLTCGPGTPYGVVSIDGWLDLQGVTTVDTARPEADGTWTSPDWDPSRLVNVALDVSAYGLTTFAQAVVNLEAAAQPSGLTPPAPVTLVIPGRDPETIYAKIRARKIPTDLQYAQGLSNASVQFYAPDPRRFGSQVAGTTGLPSSSGGITWPISFPATWTGVTQQGEVSLTNPGNTAGPLVVTIKGPVQGPSVYLEDTGMLVAFSDALTLGVRDTLVIDMDARTALLNGMSSRAAYVTSRDWFGFLPGSNTVAFQSITYDARARMTVSGYPAWK